jgi:DNA-binding response OmpR family regulator
MATILIVDDNEAFLEIACSFIEACGHKSLRATGVDEALLLARNETPDCFILDIRLGEAADGVHLFEQLKCLTKRCRVIFASAYTDYSADYLMRRGATLLIDKNNFGQDIIPALEEVFYPRVLLVDDDSDFAHIASYYFAEKRIKCVPVTGNLEMVDYLRECDLSTFDVVVTDALLHSTGNFHGWDVIREIPASYPRDSIFIFTDKSKEAIENQIGRRFDDLQTRRQLLSAVSQLSEPQVLDKWEEAWVGVIVQACSKEDGRTSGQRQ